MKILSTSFLGSFVKMDDCPKDMVPEYAFIGRSNVGKSSLINYLTGKAQLAKVSNTPGKTQTINLFLINDTWRLADLPGYGYAKVSKDKRADWIKMIRYYLANRELLACTFLLIDSRISPQKIDLEFINWMGERGLPVVIVFTKADKANAPDITKNIADFKAALAEQWENLPTMFLTSSEKRTGAEEILAYIDKINREN
jgi:GTP-binding protein